MATVGYYANCDDAYCLDCWDADHEEGWQSYAAIDNDEVVDSPIHCVKCGVLLKLPLTQYGSETVNETIQSQLWAGYRNPVSTQWAIYYEHDLDHEVFMALPYDPDWINGEDRLTMFFDHVEDSPLAK